MLEVTEELAIGKMTLLEGTLVSELLELVDGTSCDVAETAVADELTEELVGSDVIAESVSGIVDVTPTLYVVMILLMEAGRSRDTDRPDAAVAPAEPVSAIVDDASIPKSVGMLTVDSGRSSEIGI